MSTLRHLGPRIVVVAVAIGLWFWTQRLVSAKAPVKNGVGDRLHDWSAPLHAWFLARPRATNLTLIPTSVFIDLFGLSLFASSVFGPTLQPLLAIFVLFSMRQTCLALCTLPPPPGAIWHHPGFLSLFSRRAPATIFFGPHRPLGARRHPPRPYPTATARRGRRRHRRRRDRSP